MKPATKFSRKSSVLIWAVFLLFSTVGLAQDAAPVIFENSVITSASDASLTWGKCPEFMPKGCSIAVLHGDPAKRNVDVLFKIPSNYVVPNHKHSSAERMIVLSGLLEVLYEGEKPKRIKAGSYAYGPANKPHIAKCIKGPCVIFIAFEDPLDAIQVFKNKK